MRLRVRVPLGLQRLLNAHPEVCCVERRLFGEYADFVQDDGQDEPRLSGYTR